MATFGGISTPPAPWDSSSEFEHEGFRLIAATKERG
jgi:hypothetical protein